MCLRDCAQVSSALPPPETVLPSHWRHDVRTIHTSSSLRFVLPNPYAVRNEAPNTAGKMPRKELEHRAKEWIEPDADASLVDDKLPWVLWPPVGTSRPHSLALLYPGSQWIPMVARLLCDIIHIRCTGYTLGPMRDTFAADMRALTSEAGIYDAVLSSHSNALHMYNIYMYKAE